MTPREINAADPSSASAQPVLVDASGIGPGDRVMAVAAGIGNAAIPAAATGARVVASDLTSELVEGGRMLAAERGVELAWAQANAEALPFADYCFDGSESVGVTALGAAEARAVLGRLR